MVRWLDRAADASGEEKGAEVPTAKQETWQRGGSATDPPNLQEGTQITYLIPRVVNITVPTFLQLMS